MSLEQSRAIIESATLRRQHREFIATTNANPDLSESAKKRHIAEATAELEAKVRDLELSAATDEQARAAMLRQRVYVPPSDVRADVHAEVRRLSGASVEQLRDAYQLAELVGDRNTQRAAFVLADLRGDAQVVEAYLLNGGPGAHLADAYKELHLLERGSGTALPSAAE